MEILDKLLLRLDNLVSQLVNWPPLEPSMIVALLLSLVAVVVGLVLLWQAKKYGDFLLQVAVNILKDRIQYSFHQPESLTLSEIRPLAATVQTSLQSPTVTDAMIAEVIRHVILEEEERLASDRPDVHRIHVIISTLRRFDSTLKKLEPSGLRPASIGSTNSTLAYFLSALSVSLLALLGQFLLSHYANLTFLKVCSWILAAFQVWLIYPGYRALAFWRDRFAEAKALRSMPTPSRKRTPTHRILDFFLNQASLVDPHQVAVKWSPVWESLLFSAVGISMFPIAIAGITIQISRQVNVSPDTLRFILLPELVIGGLIGFYFGTWVFAGFHEYKHFEVKKLKRKLDSLNHHILLVKVGHEAPKENIIREYISVSKKLWAITGHNAYRHQEKEVRSLLNRQ